MAQERPPMRDVAARWTPHLAIAGWTPVCDVFLDCYEQLGITNLEAMFVIHLVRFKWTTQMPFPGFKKIAAKMGISTTAARGHARRLEQKGMLKRVERAGRTNRFDLTELFQRLERLDMDNRKAAHLKAALDDLIEPEDINQEAEIAF